MSKGLEAVLIKWVNDSHSVIEAKDRREKALAAVAAPELLEALEALLIWVAPIAGDNHDAESSQFAIATAENAIAKAKGELK